MQEVKVIIGASYGDEGKGLATDYFGAQAAVQAVHPSADKTAVSVMTLLSTAERPSTGIINVLTNGGPQRGHTVQLADGRRHVFKHFGSASFRGAASYFDRQFMVNPMEFMREYNELAAERTPPAAYMHPDCRFTTPWDMIANQVLQEKRGIHNSCGFGIWETVLRCRRGWGVPFHTFISMSREERITFLRRIRDVYFAKRFREIEKEAAACPGTSSEYDQDENAGMQITPKELESTQITLNETAGARITLNETAGARITLNGTAGAWIRINETAGTQITPKEIEGLPDYFFSEDLLFHFDEDCENMRILCPMRPEIFLKSFQTVLFENAQGLLLDGNSKNEEAFATPSTTGIGRVFQTVENVFENADVEVCYVSRSYLTRHGDGIMEHEIAPEQLKKQLPGVCADLTNIENCFQGRLRYGKMDTDLLTARILSDFAHCRGAARNRFRPSLMVTHLNEYATIDTDFLADHFGTLYLSDGRTAAHVTACRNRT